MNIDTAFRLLDLLMGHPGYEIWCGRCGLPLTDNLGFGLPGIGDVSIESGVVRHGEIYGDCVIAVGREMRHRELPV